MRTNITQPFAPQSRLALRRHRTTWIKPYCNYKQKKNLRYACILTKPIMQRGKPFFINGLQLRFAADPTAVRQLGHSMHKQKMPISYCFSYFD
ncbi:hypothetical protein [Chitinolyticbacter albus]|uniref:hypothetical protein n=1 Tax=Chitinolyticbacter albus TaxID=2961951 RepID=UPI00210B69D1|nr:hypothetical protein [Chitinolyticbacter albus]